MTYPVSNIFEVNENLNPAGLATADFSTAFAFAVQADLDGGSFPNDTYKDYATLDEVGEDFLTTSPPYLIAKRWFSNLPKPPSISIWMWDDVNDDPDVVAAKAVDEAWRYWLFFPESVTATEADVTGLATWADANKHFVSFAPERTVAESLGNTLTTAGNRHIFIGSRESQTVTDDASQAYANAQLAAAFQKFNPDGVRTAITGEYQVLPGVVGESLTTTQYNDLKAANVVFWTQIELQGSIDASRTINSKTPSSFNEYIDDVVNIDVLVNRLQVAGFNYIANAGTKRALDESGYAGLLDTIEGVLKQFYENGVLGTANYNDPVTGEEKLAKYGYAIISQPEDVLDLTASQRTNREFPPVQVIAILARAGHTVSVTLNVE